MTDDERCEATIQWSVRGWDARCIRRGYETYDRPGRTKIIRCWQHDPQRGIDEGEEAYREHTA